MASPFPIATAPSAQRRIADSPGLAFKTTVSVNVDAVTALDKGTQPSSVVDAPPKILPRQGEPNILITSALPYVNNVPHLGNIIGSTLSADVYARYSRSRNRNTLYICGTDEYGTATETKALEDKVSPQALCDKYHALHAQVYKWFNIGFDHFGRTTTPRQTEIAQDIFLKLNDNGYLEERTMTQLFCDRDDRFLADRYVEGICPKCGYEDARGDQCDSCGQLLDAIDLISPRCKLCSSPPVQKDSRHMFLRIDTLSPLTEAWAKETAELGGWTANGRQITESWFKEGLKPFSLTRDLKWGVPVPIKGMENKVLYVWFDAPIGYPSITANYTDQWEKWWKNPEQVKLYQFMGKDNVRFHTVIFPSCLIGTKEPWTKLHHISTTEYLQYEGGKFSKSRNIGVFGDKAGEIGVSSSVWRYYLLANRPESGDTQFSWKDFVLKNNGELLANLGNLVNRALSFLAKKYDGVLPEVPQGFGLAEGPEPLDADKVDEAARARGALEGDAKDTPFSRAIREINSLLVQYAQTMDSVKLRAGLLLVMALSSRGNVFLQEVGLDNALFEKRRQECDALMLVAVNLIWTLSALVHPFMPETSDSICAQLNAPPRSLPVVDSAPFDGDATKLKTRPPPVAKFGLDLLPGHKIGKPAHLFRRFDEKQEAEWRARFGGATAAGDASGSGGASASDQAKGSTSKKAAAKAAKAAKAAAAAAAPKLQNPTPEWKDLEAKVKEQADVVKKLKEELKKGGAPGEAQGGAKEEEGAKKVDEEVGRLLGLKKDLADLTDRLVKLELAEGK